MIAFAPSLAWFFFHYSPPEVQSAAHLRAGRLGERGHHIVRSRIFFLRWVRQNPSPTDIILCIHSIFPFHPSVPVCGHYYSFHGPLLQNRYSVFGFICFSIYIDFNLRFVNLQFFLDILPQGPLCSILFIS